MILPEREIEFRHCTLARSPLALEYPPALLDEVLEVVLEGFLAFPYGGVEVGGVLFGVPERDVLRVMAWRPVACEHAFGPGYRLSETDEQGLHELLGDYSADPALAGLVPLGWYHSHTRSGLSVSAADVEVHDRYFPEPWQIAVLLQPRDSRRTRVGFFLRDPDGSMPDAPNCVFEAGPVPAAKLPAPRERVEPAWQAPPEPPPEAPPGATLEPPAAAPPPDSSRATGAGRRSWLGPAVAACLVLLGAILVVPNLWRRTPAPPPLALRLVESNGRLDIMWNAAAPAVRQAEKGSLEITDGQGKMIFDLDANLLRSGSWPVVRQSPEVTVRLRVERAGEDAVEESAHFLGPSPASVAAAEPAATPPAKGAVEEAVVKLRAELESQLSERGRLERRLKALEQESAAAEAPPSRQPLARKTFTAPAPTPKRPAAEAPPPPTLLEPQPAMAARLAQAAPAPLPPPASTVSPEAAKPPAAYRGAASGRLIWTGLLPRDSVLTIENRRPSTGHLTGELPGVPFRMGASPAEFTAGTLTVYSSNPKFAREPVAEAPGPQNGWNRTVYRYDPRLAGGLVVTEAPGPQNGWNRAVLRSGERPLSVILLEWEIIP